MQEGDFNILARSALSKIFEILQLTAKYQDLDTDLSDDILYITLPNNGQYVINKHAPSRQIWVSSPISGASYFSYLSDRGNFLSKHDEILSDKILAELKEYE
jgi:frataxin